MTFILCTFAKNFERSYKTKQIYTFYEVFINH